MIEHTKINRLKKHVIKDGFLLLLTLVVCAFAVYKNGLTDTLTKLLTLIFYGLLGFIGFFLIYLIVCLICKITSNINSKKRKILLKRLKNYDIATEKFEYNYKLSLEDNFKRYLETIKNTVTKIASDCGFKGKYLYLNFTVVDALEFVNNTINLLENKVDYLLELPLIKNFNLKDKPISIIEKTLNTLIENQSQSNEKPTHKNKILGKTLTVGIKVLFKDKINQELNKAVNYIGVEWFLIYTKNSKKLLKQLNKNDIKKVIYD
ncbi:MAG: hypothetical protein J6Q58_03785 [Clostridia bacterium]|nr:hypothetical protein [Clostridia bacterium]